jgi:hypothetical protein
MRGELTMLVSMLANRVRNVTADSRWDDLIAKPA